MKYRISEASLQHVSKHFNENGKLDGSTFNQEVFASPKELIAYCNVNQPFEILRQENGREAHLFKLIDSNVGKCAIDLKQNYSENSIYLEDKDGYQIQCVKSSSIPDTNQFCLIVHSHEGKYDIITMYPGEYAPPLPNSKFTTEFNEYCNDFWKSKVLLV